MSYAAGRSDGRFPQLDHAGAAGAIEWLEGSIAEDVHLADIARIAELTPFHFLRVFKQEAGVTPYRFLVRARIRRSVQRLIDSKDPITNIAYEVGFGDLSNFIHTFRRELGCSPSTFRKTLRRPPTRAARF